MLDGAADRPLTLLSVGPGTGKTVLLADWVRHGGSQVAWLNPTPADAEPCRFWRLLESALRAGDDAGPGPAAAPRAAGIDLVQALFSRIPEPAARLVVIIDDAHVLTHSDVLAGLDSLIRGSPPGLRLIVAARSDPLLPLHRYRLAGQMHELAARTEGWAAGVRLSAMRMEGTEHPADFVSELALDPGSIGEYLVNEVPRDQPEPQRRLLIETSFLDEVTGSLADAIPPLLAVMRDIMLADLDTSLGRPHAALRLLRNYRGTEFAILTATARARAYLVLNDLRDAQGCIRSVLTTPSAQSGRFVLVEAMIILPFLKVKDEFAEMLARPPNVAARWPVPRPRMPAEAAAEPAAVISRDLPEPLTPRELTILRMLATSMSNSEIADELCLSVNMVKTHLAANYRKLPAGRRREAVSRARQLELI